MTKFGKSEKMDYPVSYSGTSDFGSFRVKLRKELKLKI
jgi:rRNA maturation protein Nop10